jgi:hypothetical protein
LEFVLRNVLVIDLNLVLKIVLLPGLNALLAHLNCGHVINLV